MFMRVFVGLLDRGGAGVCAGDVRGRHHDLGEPRARDEAMAEHLADGYLVGRRDGDALGDVHCAAAPQADDQVAARRTEQLTASSISPIGASGRMPSYMANGTWPRSRERSAGSTSPRSTIDFLVTTRALVPPRALTSDARPALAPKPNTNLLGDWNSRPRSAEVILPPILAGPKPAS